MLYWIPLVALYYILFAIFSKYSNDNNTNNNYTIALFILQAVGLWPIITRYSSNIIRDGILFDIIAVTMFYFTVVFMGGASKFTAVQWVGTFVAIIGVLMMKVGVK
jgi:hypothetical protein